MCIPLCKIIINLYFISDLFLVILALQLVFYISSKCVFLNVRDNISKFLTFLSTVLFTSALFQ